MRALLPDRPGQATPAFSPTDARPPAPRHGGFLRLDIPAGLSPEAYFAGLFVTALLCVTGVTLLFLALIALVRTSGALAHPYRFTVAGQLFFHPEYETDFFLAACAAGLAATVAVTWAWNRRLRHRPPGPPRRAPMLGWLVVAGMVPGLMAGGLAAFFAVRSSILAGKAVALVDVLALVGIGALGLVLAAAGSPDRFQWHRSPRPRARPSGRRRPVLLDLLVPAFVVAAIYVPAWSVLAGRIFTSEEFFHWDYYAMGPALAFQHGAALGTAVHTEYGLGWPVLYALISPVLRLSYGHMLAVAVVYGSLYFVGVYVLLRFVTKRAAWAAAGTLVALLVQLFSGTFPKVDIWQFPSLTLLRRPMDVWVFLALALYLSSRRAVWGVLAGALTGLALVFATDTGLYLAVAFACCWLFVATLEPRRRMLAACATSCVAALAVFALGVAVASRGTLLDPRFWTAWWESIRQGAQGFTALPMVGRADVWGSSLPGRGALAFFAVVVIVYLGLAGRMAIKGLHRRSTPTDVFLGSLSVYGLFALISFLGRSDPLNLPHTLVPFAIVVTVLAAQAHRGLRPVSATGGGVARLAWGAAPSLAICSMAAVLALNPAFRGYPGVLQQGWLASSPTGLCLVRAPRDVCALPASSSAYVAQVQAVTAEMRRLAASDSVAVLDFRAEYNLISGVAPYGSHVPLLDNLFEQSQLATALAEFTAHRPTWVFIRPAAQEPAFSGDVSARFHEDLQQHYTLDHQSGPFEVWRLRAP